jgi:hypothetical protein
MVGSSTSAATAGSSKKAVDLPKLTSSPWWSMLAPSIGSPLTRVPEEEPRSVKNTLEPRFRTSAWTRETPGSPTT